MVFSYCISLMSWHIKTVLGGSWKHSLWRHRGWEVLHNYPPSLLPHLPSGGDQINPYFCANILQLGTPGTPNNSLHQSGVSVDLAFHATHLQRFCTGSSGGGPSSSEVSADPFIKDVTLSSNSSSSPSSNHQWLPLPTGLKTPWMWVAGSRVIGELHLVMPSLMIFTLRPHSCLQPTP